jgi:hypothetical protein
MRGKLDRRGILLQVPRAFGQKVMDGTGNTRGNRGWTGKKWGDVPGVKAFRLFYFFLTKIRK